MPNANTIAQAASSAGGGLPSVAGGASSTAEFIFQDRLTPANSLLLKVGAPQLKNKQFKIRAGGRVTGGTTTNYTPRLRLDSLTGTVIEAGTARAVNSEDANWFIEALVTVDPTSDKLGGFGRAMVNNLYDVEAAIDNEAAADPDGELVFSCTGQFSASHADNAAICDYLEVDVQ